MDGKKSFELKLKESFELYYNGGSIWAEHLDGMGNREDEIINKFKEDFKKMKRPSMTSFTIINLDETNITKTISETIIDAFKQCEKDFRKIALIGVPKNKQDLFFGIGPASHAMIKFLDDYEKAKEWCLP